MKKNFYLFLAFISSSVIAQNPINLFHYNKNIWLENEVQMNNNTKQKIILGDEIPPMVKDKYITLEKYLSSFHPMYLNDDTLIDFIYKGPAGAESDLVEILMNRGDKLENIFSKLGNVNNIIRTIPEAPSIIFYEQYGCCDDPLNYCQQLTLIPGPEGIEIKYSDKIYYYEETEFPETFTQNILFKVKNTPYKLRATPEIIDAKNFSSHFEQGNIIGEFGADDIGYALAGKTDKTGRVWWFVIMDKTKHSELYLISKERNEKWCGWMSSRFLETYNNQ